MKTIEYIKTHGLPKLIEDFKLNAVYHETLPLVLLKYDQIESPKYHEIVRECRTLILELNSWKVVAKSFRRFYNLNEYKDEIFDWANFSIEEKIDGSLITLFHYNDNWHISTSGSFAKGKINNESPTWEELFFSILSRESFAHLCYDHTYIFELCSPYNKVVKLHKQTHIVLLNIICRNSLKELSNNEKSNIAEKINCKIPTKYNFPNINDAVLWLETQPSDFEGFVLVDNNANRIKAKNANYLSLHGIAGNGYIYLTRRLLPLVLNKQEEKDEILSYFPEIKQKWDYLEGEICRVFKDADEILALYHDYDQKKFALAIKGESKLLKAILFSCRLNKTKPSLAKKEFESLLIKYFEESNVTTTLYNPK